MNPLLLPALLLVVLALGLGLWLGTTSKGRVSLGTGLLIKLSLIVRAKVELEESIPARRQRSEKETKIVALVPRRPLEVSELSLPGPGGSLRLRSYRNPARRPRALLLFLHGGGWILGSLDSYDPLARRLCLEAGLQVLSLDYRLAPEQPYPAAVEDVVATWSWIHAEKAAGRLPDLPVFVAGDSAGGNLAAVLCLRARELGLRPPAGQILLYPVTDLSHTDTASYRDFAEGFLLDRKDMIDFIESYIPDPARRAEGLASPLLHEDLSGLAPALVLTAGLDVLRDEGEAYARRLEAAGNRVLARRFKGLVHGFASMGRFVPQSGRALRLIADFVAREVEGGRKTG
jgi:acetyl esterase